MLWVFLWYFSAVHNNWENKFLFGQRIFSGSVIKYYAILIFKLLHIPKWTDEMSMTLDEICLFWFSYKNPFEQIKIQRLIFMKNKKSGFVVWCHNLFRYPEIFSQRCHPMLVLQSNFSSVGILCSQWFWFMVSRTKICAKT